MADETSSIRALTRGIDVLRAISQSGPLALSEIAAMTRLAHSTVVRLVRTLEGESLVRREDGSKRYIVTEAALGLSSGFNDDARLREASRAPIHSLTSEFGWPVAALTRIGGHMVVRHSSVRETSLTFHIYDPGVRVPIFASAAGRAYWAFCDADARGEMIAAAPLTQPEVAPAALAEFDDRTASEIRSAGHAIVVSMGTEERLRGNGAIAVPVLLKGKPVAALSLVFFGRAVGRDDAVTRLAMPLEQAAKAIANDLSRKAQQGSPYRTKPRMNYA